MIAGYTVYPSIVKICMDDETTGAIHHQVLAKPNLGQHSIDWTVIQVSF